MQTFLPYSDFTASAYALDMKRLGKQRVECKQILFTLRTPSSTAWQHHPAVEQWRGYEMALIEYAIAICKAWRSIGYKDSLLPFFQDQQIKEVEYPEWLGLEIFHSSHRAILLAKNEKWYYQFKWCEQPAIKNAKGQYPYVWPSRLKGDKV